MEPRPQAESDPPEQNSAQAGSCRLCAAPLGTDENSDICHRCSTRKSAPTVALNEAGRNIRPFMARKNLEGGIDLAQVFATVKGDSDGKYQLGDVLAEGGMGAVISVRDNNCRRPVAMKVLHSHLDDKPEAVLRFIEEAQITAQLEHPNIVPVHELAVDPNDKVYYTMKYVQGRDLKDILCALKNGDPQTIVNFPLPRLLNIFMRTCDAIAFAHDKGVVHRDIKPENIMVGDFGEVQVLDWGLAKVIGRDARSPQGTGIAIDESAPPAWAVQSIRSDDLTSTHTMVGEILGTPTFMAPEQARGRVAEIDTRSDIYALGGILYNIITLRQPIKDGPVHAMLLRITHGDIPDPMQLARAKKLRCPHWPNGVLPESLSAVARKALALASADRYQRVQELQAEIEAFQHGFATLAESASLRRQILLLIRRHLGISIVAAIAMTVLAVSSGYFLKQIQDERNAALQALDKLQAEQRTRRIISRRSAPEFIDKAAHSIEIQDFPTARAAIDFAIDLSPKDRDALAILGRLQFAELDFIGAEFNLREAGHPLRYAAIKNLGGLSVDGYHDAIARLQHDNDRTILAAFLDNVLAAGRHGGTRHSIETGLLAALARLPGYDGAEPAGRYQIDESGISLDLSGNAYEFTDLRRLAGLPIVSFTSDDRLRDLSFLRGMPVRHLDIRNAPLRRLDALANTRLHALHLGKIEVDASTINALKVRELHLHGSTLTNIPQLAGAYLIVHLHGEASSRFSEFADTPLDELHIHRPNGANVLDYAPLANFNLNGIGITDSKLANLDFLAGKPLTHLVLHGPEIADLSALTGMPLTALDLSDTGVADIAILTGMPLRQLYLNRTQVADLTPLSEMPLEELELMQTPVADLSPLAGVALRRINISSTRVRELAPLAGMPLSYLHLAATAVADIAIAAAMPLEDVALSGCANLRDISPLGECAGLRDLVLPDQVDTLAPLRGLANLRAVNTEWDWHRQSAKVFWLRQDLAEANPGYDGSGEFVLDHGRLREVRIRNAPLRDLSPLAGLPLEVLDLGGSVRDADLSTLEAMPIRILDLSHSDLADIATLSGMPLQQLNLSGCDRLTSLVPLAGMQLHKITLDGCTSLPDLQGLQGHPLNELSAAFCTNLQDVSAIAELPLQLLDLGSTALEDLGPLSKLRLRELRIGRTAIADLQPLRGMKLQGLDISHTPVKNLQALAKKPFSWLHADGCQIDSLAPLNSSQLRELRISHNRLSSLEPLAGAPLRLLACSHNELTQIKALQGAPLQVLDLSYNQIADFAPLREASDLRTLDISHNPAERLPLASLDLQWLACAHSNLSELGRLDLAKVRRLITDSECFDRAVDGLEARRDAAGATAIEIASAERKLERLKAIYSEWLPRLGERYQLIAGSYTFDQAWLLSRQTGGRLVHIGDAAEFAYVQRLAHVYGPFWIDLQNEDGAWEHLDGSPASYLAMPEDDAVEPPVAPRRVVLGHQSALMRPLPRDERFAALCELPVAAGGPEPSGAPLE
jgi:serine/threonine protein kinase/Leucine-rich repeat (LRR) protein